MVLIMFRGQEFRISNRDSHKRKLYTAERHAFVPFLLDGRNPPSIEECRAFIEDEVMASDCWAQLREDFHRPTRIGDLKVIGPRSDARRAWARQHEIHLPPHMRTRYVMLHEAAHVLVGTGTVGHHWPFALAYLGLVRGILGASEEAKLRDSFKFWGVKHAPPRVLSPEQRAALAERGRAALEAYRARSGPGARSAATPH